MDACECSRLISELDYIHNNRRARGHGSRSSIAIHDGNHHICWEKAAGRALLNSVRAGAQLRNRFAKSHSYHNIETRMNISLILHAPSAPGQESKNRTLARRRIELRVSIQDLAAQLVQFRGK